MFGVELYGVLYLLIALICELYSKQYRILVEAFFDRRKIRFLDLQVRQCVRVGTVGCHGRAFTRCNRSYAVQSTKLKVFPPFSHKEKTPDLTREIQNPPSAEKF